MDCKISCNCTMGYDGKITPLRVQLYENHHFREYRIMEYQENSKMMNGKKVIEYDCRVKWGMEVKKILIRYFVKENEWVKVEK